MALDWLPDATRDPHPRSFPWQDSAPCKGVLHTTEGSGWPTYQGWTIMPHATILPTPGKGVAIRQHLPFSQGSFALAHPGGTLPVGGAHAFQFELIGTSEKGGPGLYWPDADDTILLDLFKKVIKPLSDAYSIPLAAPVFLPYPASYGNSPVRMGQQQWVNFNGWAGHQHAASNDHGDPGAFPFARMVKLGGQQPPNPPTVPPLHGPLKYGSQGGDVQRVQHRLNKQFGVDVAEDGDFGRATQREVIAWQKKHNLGQDGIVGKQTAVSMGFTYTQK